MKLSKTNSNQEVTQKREIKPILWTCTVAAPEMTVLLYSLNGLVLYHVSSYGNKNKAYYVYELFCPVGFGMLHV